MGQRICVIKRSNRGFRMTTYYVSIREQLKNPCNKCNLFDRILCIIACKDYDSYLLKIEKRKQERTKIYIQEIER